jgi:hypothetical protein
MANEYLQRTPTSTGNTRVWTWSGWLKLNDTAAAPTNIFMARTIAGGADFTYIDSNAGEIRFADDATYANNTARKIRDSSGWFHLLCNLNTTSSSGDDRMNIYINGVLESNLSSASNPVINYQATVNTIILHTIGNNSNVQYGEYNITDVFLVDGQALTPDVFGFYKQGKGYISVGSTQATDFRPGQWVPKTPRVIKTEINRRGGFGVNGFYLPMNDSNNFGADFHGDPNSIITLNEKLPQPRVGVASTAAVGLGFTDVLRADPYAANLVLALPFISSGLCTNGTNVGVNTGFGDYSAIIKGSGSAKTITINGNVSIANTASYYGSAAQFTGIGSYLNVSQSTDFDFGTGSFTVECWVYPNTTPSASVIIQGQTSTAGNFGFNLSAPGSSSFFFTTGGSSVFFDLPIRTGQWSHITAVRNGSSNLTVYVNGVAAGISTTFTNNIITSAGPRIGSNDSGASSWNGYIQDLRVYKGVAKYTGGFDVPRPYTPVGIATWRAVPDTNANNFATQQPTNGSSSQTLTDGNLTQVSSSTAWNTIRGSVGVSTGKWYWEVRMSGSANTIMVGVDDNLYQVTTNPSSSYVGAYSNSWSVYLSDGNKRNNTGSGSAYGSSFLTGDICMVALDTTNGRIFWGKNGTWFNSGDPVSGTNAAYTNLIGYSQLMPATSTFDTNSRVNINFGQNPTFSGNTTAGTFTDTNGKGLFKYQPPSGFLALCEDNLPTPEISDPGKYFKTVLYTGDGASGRSIVGVGFQPDFVWIKSRSPSAYNHRVFDSVRGAGKDNFLLPNSTAAEGASSDHFGGISSFNADGFSMVYGTGGSNIGINESGTNFVAWCWRAGAGTTSTNTNGSITSVVSVNQDAGFSIVSYPSGQGSNFTIGHGLNKAPKLIIAKSRNAATNWGVYFTMLGTNTNWMILDSTAAVGANNSTLSDGAFMISNTTTLQISTGAFANQGTQAIAYCWAEIEGFSKFGSYVGNNNSDGPFVFTNGKPAFVMIKRTDSTGNWCMHDSSRSGGINVMNEQLQANLSNIESGTGGLIDFLSNGFKIRATSTDLNASGGTYIYACWMESPFTTANSK